MYYFNQWLFWSSGVCRDADIETGEEYTKFDCFLEFFN